MNHRRTHHTLRVLMLTLLCVALLLGLFSAATAQGTFGTNWTAQYYNSNNLTGAIVATQTGINGINFNWGESSPIPGTVNVDSFSARFTSVQQFTAGTYEFVLSSDDGARVTIDGQVALDVFVGRSLTTDRFTRTMSGQHTIIVEYFENTGPASISFQWFLQGSAVPTSVGTPGQGVPTGVPVTSAPAFTAAVTGVRGLSLRTGPYLGATLIAVLRPDIAYPISGRNRDEGTFTWYLVTTAEGETGWASGRYLTITGNPDAIPVVGSVFDQIDGAPATGVIAAPRAYMNLRRRPSLRVNPPLDQVPWGAEVDLIGRTVQGGVNQWFQVRYNGQVGWIFASFVSVRGDINAVPIR